MASHSHPFGGPVNTLKFGDDNKFIIDNAALNTMFLHPEVKHRKVVVLSIIGAFRKGKSFFLDYCLRYLYATYQSVGNPNMQFEEGSSWMGDENQPLKGFSWSSGVKRDTTGIIMWSDIFLHTISTTGEKIAIVVMDTQGLFDHETSPADNSRIFALGTLISSIQILNLVGSIQEDQLQYLQFATEFAKFASQDSQGSTSKPFQNLLFLIRDWNNPDDFLYGTEGGDLYLKGVLKIKSDQKPELKYVRQFVNASFDQVNCCLMPHPGKYVSTKKNYDGRWKLMDEEFKDELVKIIEKLLSEENLIFKKINSKDLKGFEVKEYIETYFQLFQSDELPPTQSIYESTVEKQMTISIEKCVEFYKQSIYTNRDLMMQDNLNVFHLMSKSQALLMFKDEKKMGNSDHEIKYKAKLEQELDDLFQIWSKETLEHIEKLEKERKKTEEALQEKNKLERDALEAERITIEKQANLERQKELQQIENEKYEAEKRTLESRLQAERDRARSVEAEKDAQISYRAALEEKLRNEISKTTADALQEKLRLEQNVLEAERVTREKLAELEMKKQLQQLEKDKNEFERKILESQIEQGNERLRALESEKALYQQVMDEKAKNDLMKAQIQAQPAPRRRKKCSVM